MVPPASEIGNNLEMLEEQSRVTNYEGHIKTDKTARVSPDLLPSLPRQFDGKPVDFFSVPLELLKVRGSGREVLVGTLIAGKDIVRAYEILNRDQLKRAETCFYSHLAGYIDGQPVARRVKSDAVKRPILYFRNLSGGLRIYFLEPEKIDGQPVIIRIAVCYKNQEVDILSHLTNTRRKDIKKAIS